MLTTKDIAKMIDHSLLKPNLTDEDIRVGCELAKAYDVASVCVRPTDVKLTKQLLDGSDVLVSAVIGFPHGSNVTAVKVLETEIAIEEGAVELDMVLNIGKLLSREFEFVKEDIRRVVEVAHKGGAIVKVIFENCYLTNELKEIACKICEEVGADFVKTSTGYGTDGATIEDLKIMRANCSEKVRVKAAGGVRTLNGALAVRKLGGCRFGATATKAILEDAKNKENNGLLKELADGDQMILVENY